MKKKLYMLGLGILLIGASIITACTKEGPMGAQGPAGTNGTNGTNGKDASVTCGQCHDMSDALTVIMMQYEKSIHYTGIGTGYAGGRANCSQCHSSQGFRTMVSTGFLTAPGFATPAPIGCRTCHKIHETYTGADYALRTVADVRSLNDSVNTKFAFGKGNLCANCHQARLITPKPDITTAGATYKIASSRIGPHHGPQANMLIGYQKSGASEITGIAYVTTQHAHAKITNGCVTCHTYNKDHTFTANNASCAPCHDAATAAAKVASTQKTVTDLLAQLKTKLIANGVLDAASDLAKTGTFNAKWVGAFINYKFVQEDKSLGVHNPPYTVTLLQNSIAALP